VARRLARPGRDLPVVALWALATVTTVVLNLDTTVVLLTPLYLRLARRAGVGLRAYLGAVVPIALPALAAAALTLAAERVVRG
jgi:arsenical pump membrane protein